jgi:hypothetical protein
LSRLEEGLAVGSEVATQAQMESNLLVSSEDASLSYSDGAYEVTIIRNLINRGTDPVAQFSMRVFVNRYPEEPERSRQHHQKFPLTWSELAFEGWCDDRPMAWQSFMDRAEAKGITLVFANNEGTFPLLPGRACTLSYSYRVLDNKWGPWFSRRIRTPTERLAITAEFPGT